MSSPSRALTGQDVEGAHVMLTVAAHQIQDSSRDTQLAAAGTSLNMGMGFGAVWLLEGCQKEQRLASVAAAAMGDPVLQGDHFQAVLRPEQLRRFERHFEPPFSAAELLLNLIAIG